MTEPSDFSTAVVETPAMALGHSLMTSRAYSALSDGSEKRSAAVAALVYPVTASVLILVTVFVFVKALAPSESVLAATAIFISATTSSMAGFAFSAICGGVLFHIIESPVEVVETMLVCSIAIQTSSVFALRRSIEWRTLAPFLLGGIGGIPIGVLLLLHVKAGHYTTIIGVFLAAYGTYMIFRPATILPQSRLTDCVVGFVGGVTGGFAAFPGAAVTIWCALKGWDKYRQRGIYQPFILIMQLLALALISLLAINSHEYRLGLVTLGYVPAAVLGTWCGLRFFQFLTDRQFATVVQVLLIVSGIALML